MVLKQYIEVYDLLDSADANGDTVSSLFRAHGVGHADVVHLKGKSGETDFVRIVIPGTSGKNTGGVAPTLGIVGRLGGLGARPDYIGFVSDGDGALGALSAGLKIADMARNGDNLPGDVVVCTNICPNAPVIDHEPTKLMGAPFNDADINYLETEYPVDAVLSLDTTKGNRIINRRGFAISCTVKDGYILRVSDSLLDIMMRVTGEHPVVFPLSMQDITPYGNGIYHLNSILQPSIMTHAPVVGVAITSAVPVAGCATGATQWVDVELAARFLVEVAKDFTAGRCSFYNQEEFGRLQELYGSMKHLQEVRRL
ncbi:MAG: DUF1177 domain-containing protein [Flexilinea sp.]